MKHLPKPELPAGDSFHDFDTELFNSPPPDKAFHAYVQMKDLNDGVKFATRLALDRARREGHNPRNGTLTVYFDDNGVGAKWEPKP